MFGHHCFSHVRAPVLTNGGEVGHITGDLLDIRRWIPRKSTTQITLIQILKQKQMDGWMDGRIILMLLDGWVEWDTGKWNDMSWFFWLSWRYEACTYNNTVDIPICSVTLSGKETPSTQTYLGLGFVLIPSRGSLPHKRIQVNPLYFFFGGGQLFVVARNLRSQDVSWRFQLYTPKHDKGKTTIWRCFSCYTWLSSI